MRRSNEKIELIRRVGKARKGQIFIRGLHGVPDSEVDIWDSNKPEDFYWREDSSKQDNDFLYDTWLKESDFIRIN